MSLLNSGDFYDFVPCTPQEIEQNDIFFNGYTVNYKLSSSCYSIKST